MVVGTAATVSAFLITLYVAERNYRRGREHIPHLSVRLHVNRVAVSRQHEAIIITLGAENTDCPARRLRMGTGTRSPSTFPHRSPRTGDQQPAWRFPLSENTAGPQGFRFFLRGIPLQCGLWSSG